MSVTVTTIGTYFTREELTRILEWRAGLVAMTGNPRECDSKLSDKIVSYMRTLVPPDDSVGINADLPPIMDSSDVQVDVKGNIPKPDLSVLKGIVKVKRSRKVS